jgi:hypothetical protein
VTRARAALTVAVLAAGGCGNDLPCRSQTLFLDISLDARSAAADVINFSLQPEDGEPPYTGATTHVPTSGHADRGSVEITFPTYPAGSVVDITVTATLAGVEVGRGTAFSLTLLPNCTRNAVTVEGETGDMGAPPDFANAPPPDLAPATGDLAKTPDGSSVGWKKQSSGTTYDLYGITYGGTPPRFVAVGQMGITLVSADGANWSVSSASTASTLRSVVYGGVSAPRFVTVGTNGVVFTSDDGVSWTQRTSKVTAQLNVVARTNTTFVAAGNAGAIQSSVDGISWTLRSSDVTDDLFGIGVSSVSAALGFSGAVTVTTDQGTTWTHISGTPVVEFSAATFAGLPGPQKFFGVGNAGAMYSSGDTIGWQSVYSATGNWLSGITYASDIPLLVAVGASGTIVTSPDGTTWTAAPASPTTNWLNGVGYGNGRFVAVGASGTIVTFP